MPNASLPPDHAARMDRVHLALEGLSVGDAFGERFFLPNETVRSLIDLRVVPQAPWRYTDDTVMALSIAEVLDRHGGIDQDDLAGAFVRRYLQDPKRGYGGMAHIILQDMHAGTSWREAAAHAFSGSGSMGNGGAMRAAPVGAYFAEDLDSVISQARASAEVTHAHPEGQAGAIAVALAAAFAWRSAHASDATDGTDLLAFVLDRMPEGQTREGVARAQALPPEASDQYASTILGCGYLVTSPDTVPFALWCAARYLNDYEQGMWATVSALGDRDTTCAIVGGIVALAVGRASIPAAWLAAREPLAYT